MLSKRILALVSLLLISFLLVGCFPFLNQPPGITSEAIKTATVGVEYVYNVDATDPNTGDVLTYSLTDSPSDMLIDEDSGLITWTPTAAGDFSVTVHATDEKGLSDTQSFTITVVSAPVTPVAPTLTVIANQIAYYVELFTYTVVATAGTEPVLAFSLPVAPTMMSINSITGVISWTPIAAQLGYHNVTVKVTAADGLFDETSFVIEVKEPVPPVVELTSIVVLPETMTLFVGESKPVTSVTAHYDDGSTAVVALGSCTYASSATGIATVSNGVITAIAKGTATITVSYGGKTDTVAVTLSEPILVNHAPVITPIPGLTAIIGVTFTYDVEASDPDGDVLTYSLIVKPVGMSIGSATGVISWIPNATGDYDVTVKASDGKSSDTQPFTITVVTVEITGIEVEPDTMTLFVGVSETIGPVTATYEIKKGFVAPIDLGDCTYGSSDTNVATVSNAGVVTGVTVGGATITVTYAGKSDTIVVTVSVHSSPVHNIDTDKYYTTIQSAIDDVSTLPGDTITVAAGTYNEAVSIDKQLTLLGAQYDVDPTVEGARIDGSAESVIDAGGSSAVVTITADSVIVNGFTITNGGGVAPSHLRGGVYLSGTLVSGCTISNNKIVENLRDGIDSCSSGSGVNVFENNVISNNGYGAVFLGRYEGGDIFRNNVISYNADGGETGQIGIQSGDNIVEDNTINGDSLYGILIMGSGVDIRENNILRKNIINRGESGPGFTVGGICITFAKNTLVEDNTIHNNVTGVSVGGSTDTTSLRGNDIQGNNEYGIKVGYPGYDTKDTTIEENDVLSNEVGIWIRSAIAASTTHINQNNIVGNTDYGVLNETSTPVDATDNWWGSEHGPQHDAFPPEGGNAVSDNVDYVPYSTSQH